MSTWAFPPVWESWTWPGAEGRPLDVWIYSACDSVRLFLNDRLVGETSTSWEDKCRAHFRVPYASGTLRVVGFDGDTAVAECFLETTGPTIQVRLTPDRTSLMPDGQDLSFITVEVLDKEGRLVNDANCLITFHVDGPGQIAGVCSGDPLSEEPYKGDRHRLFHGRGLVVIRAGHDNGYVKLVAESEGLKSSEVCLEVTGENPRQAL